MAWVIRVRMRSAARRHCSAARSATGAVGLFNAALPASAAHVCGMSGTAVQSPGGMQMYAVVIDRKWHDAFRLARCRRGRGMSGRLHEGVSSGAVDKWRAEAGRQGSEGNGPGGSLRSMRVGVRR